MNIYPTIITETTILKNGIIKIPELEKREKEEIQVIIVFKEKTKNENEKNISLSGKLKKYANPELIEKETDIAWSLITE